MAKEKMEVDGDGKAKETTVAAASAPVPVKTMGETLKDITQSIERTVKSKDTRLLQGRLLRQTATIRKQLSPAGVKAYLAASLPAELESRAFLSSTLDMATTTSSMETDEAALSTSTSAVAEPSASSTPEVEMYAYVLTLLYLSDTKQWQLVKAVSTKALERLTAFNRRTMDLLSARVYFYYSLSYEHTGDLNIIRSTLLALHRTCVLRHDALGQETLMNLLLRNYLAYNLYDQAEKFRSKAHKAEQWRSPQQYCRYLYYLGRIRTIQLEYSEAKDCLQQAVRKGPQSAHGFRITVSKWLILVRLLLGEIPERSEFAQLGLFVALQPYFQLALAVKGGDLVAFAKVAEGQAGVFKGDSVLSLVTRLHHNVIRTGLRRINLAYSRISLADIATKLGLQSAEDAECIVAKAIRDGGIDAVLDHEAGFMASRERRDVYSTGEPRAAFHARIAFCLDLHNDAVKAMRYEPDAHKKRLESADARAERLAQEQELAKALEEEEDEF